MVELLVPIQQFANQGWVDESGLSEQLHLSLDEPWGQPDDDQTFAETFTQSLYGDQSLDLLLSTPTGDGPFLSVEIRIRGRKFDGGENPRVHWTLTDNDGSPLLSGFHEFVGETYQDMLSQHFVSLEMPALTSPRLRFFNGVADSGLRLTTLAVAVDDSSPPTAYGHEALLDFRSAPRPARRYFVFPY